MPIDSAALTVRYRIRNAGYSRVTTTTYTRIYYSEDNVITPTDVVLYSGNSMDIPLNAGAVSPSSGLSQFNATVPTSATPGTRYIGLHPDYDGRVAEENEADNLRLGTFTVSGAVEVWRP